MKVRTNTVTSGNKGYFSFVKFEHGLESSNIFTFNDTPPHSQNEHLRPHWADSVSFSQALSKVIPTLHPNNTRQQFPEQEAMGGKKMLFKTL